ncbi:MAG: flagellar hook assembly protein FlgD [Rhodoferax sp.]|nr:flagellar hook assembly protein FlgD [Pseudorhodobacter sp.]
MEIAQTTANAATPTPAKPSAISSDFNTFLKMLTTQLKNQDPLKPIDSADYAVQLATFSGVEQQVKTNQLLEGLSSQFGVMGMSQLAAWVGQEARATGPVWMDGDAVTLAPEPKAGADRAVLVIRDATGAMMAREDMAGNTNAYEWRGMDVEGNPLPTGTYSLSLESYSGDRLLGVSDVQAYSRIMEAKNGPLGTTLILEGGIEIAAKDITALRVP